MRHIVVVEVDVAHVGRRLVVARDVGDGGNGILLGQHAQRQR